MMFTKERNRKAIHIRTDYGLSEGREPVTLKAVAWPVRESYGVGAMSETEQLTIWEA